MKGLKLAISSLTILRCSGDPSQDLSVSLYWFPVVGLLIGGGMFGFLRIMELWPHVIWPSGLALLLVVGEAWITRGLHMDGLADWADSIGGIGGNRRLEIMKDTSVGVFGVLALITAFSVRWVSLGCLITSSSFIWVIPAMSIPRTMMVELCATVPYARPGKGTGRAFVETASLRHRIVAHSICLCICYPFGPLGIVSMGMSLIITKIFAVRCRHSFGGITGDLLGTANEMLTMLLLLVYAFIGSCLPALTGWLWLR
ncbi:MAG: adenosylcobinamide-GDP ribazoletransferase [Deltaproteobacteria bacterium]|nr:adenosylcobinamide-GDP ribazoletransferase [Deltaproteobacteria bacterium]